MSSNQETARERPGKNSAEEMSFDFVPEYTAEQVSAINNLAANASRFGNFADFCSDLSNELCGIGLHANRQYRQASLEIKARQSRFTACMYRIKDDITMIGRKSDCAIILSEKIVSAEHAKILSRGNDYMIVDLKSLNGTFINGTILPPMVERKLQPGDIIQIGSFSLIFNSHVKKEKPLPMQFQILPVRESVREAVDVMNPDNYIAGIFRIQGNESNIYLFIPLALCHTIAYQLLGDLVDETKLFCPVGELEMAFLEYVLMKASFVFKRFQILLEHMGCRRANVNLCRKISAQHYTHCEVWGETNDIKYCMLLFMPPIDWGAENEHEFRIPRVLRDYSVEIPLTAGYSNLILEQFKSIEEGDVILLDECTVSLSDSLPSGKVHLLAGREEAGFIEAEIFNTEQGLMLKINSFS